MKMIKNNRKVRKVGLYTALILLGTGLTIYPQSNSKYIDIKDDALIYNTSLSQLYKGGLGVTLTGEKFEANEAFFSFAFDRSKIAGKTDKDVYEIVIPEHCAIVSVKSQLLNTTTQENTLEYTTDEDDHVEVTIKCQIDKISQTVDNKDYYRFSIAIKERIADDEHSFTYLDSEINQQYVKPTPPEESPLKFTISKSSTNKLEEFLNQLALYNTSIASPYEEQLRTYFKSMFTKESDIFNSIRGLTVQYQETVDEYQFELEALDTLIGYARTHFVKEQVPEFMYFSSFTKEDLEEAFGYYLTEYAYKGDADSPKLIQDYLKYLGNTYSAVQNEHGTYDIMVQTSDGRSIKMYGLVYYADEHRISLNDNVLDFAYNTLNHTIRVAFDTRGTMGSAFQNSILLAYGDIVTEEANNVLINSRNIYNSVIKNRTGQTVSNIDDYFIVSVASETTPYYLLVRVHSNAETNLPEDQYTYVDISIFDPSNIAFATTPSNITIDALTTDKDSIATIVDHLNQHFNKTVALTDDDYTVSGVITSAIYPVN